MNSLSHTSWECKYHIVFAPKYRRQVIYEKMKAEIENIPSKYSVSEIVGYLKEKSSLIIFDRHANLELSS